MGPRSTAPFIDLVITECQTQYGARDDIDFPRMMICGFAGVEQAVGQDAHDYR